MGFFSKLLGATPVPDPWGARRELLRAALRDTLKRHGIPPAWIGAETLVAASRGVAQKGIHWRLLIKHWDPELLTCAVAFQQSLVNRLMSLDADSATWLMGISWQFALPDESVCPPMPQGPWGIEKPKQPAKATAAVTAGTAATDAKAGLEQMFAARDAQLRHDADDEQTKFQRTEPSPLS
jgi:hypothetical protein